MKNAKFPAKLLFWTIAAILALAAGLALGRFLLNPDGGGKPGTTSATVLSQPRPLPDIRLTDAAGDAFGRRQFTGDWHLLFFGFTHCPDVCPNTLGLLTAVGERIAASGAQPPQTVFVSVDPRRDNPAALRAYLDYFDDGLIGLTGELEQIRQLTGALYLPFDYSGDVESGEYTVEHSAALVLVDPEARASAYFTPPHDPAALAADLRRLMRTR